MTTPNNTVAGLAAALEWLRSLRNAGWRNAGHIDAIEAALASPAPSAGVGVEAVRQAIEALPNGYFNNDGHTQRGNRSAVAHLVCAALSQHPAAPSVSPAVEGGWLAMARELYDRCSIFPEKTADGMTALLELRNHVHTLLATPEQPGSAVQGEDWRPIATVPRDGTRVIVWMPEGIPSSASYGPVSEPQATHWMPLHGPACTTPPPAPAAAPGAAPSGVRVDEAVRKELGGLVRELRGGRLMVSACVTADAIESAVDAALAGKDGA